MSKSVRFLIAAGLALLTNLSHALPPLWDTKFAQPIQWQQMTFHGVLVVVTRDAMVGIDGKTGATLWRNRKLGGISNHGFSELSPSSLVMIQKSKAAAVKSQLLAVDVMTGRVVLDTQRDGLKTIYDQRVISTTNTLLAVAETQTGKAGLFAFDISSGKLRWSNTDLTNAKQTPVAAVQGFMNKLSALSAAIQARAPIVDGPLTLADGSFLLSVAGGSVYRIHSASGALMWRQKYFGGRVKLHANPLLQNSVLIEAIADVGESSNSEFQRVSLDDGSVQWQKPRRWRKPQSEHVIFRNEGIVVSEFGPQAGRVKLLDYQTGQSLWGKNGNGLKIKGGVVDHADDSRGLVLTTAVRRRVANAVPIHAMYVLDVAKGALKFKTPLQILGDLQFTRTIPKGLLYATSHEMDVFDPSTGKRLNAKPVLGKKRGILTLQAGNEVRAYNADSGILQKLALSSGKISNLSSGRVKLKGADKPRSIEARGGDTLLLGTQQVVAWDGAGTLKFHEYYPAPKEAKWLQALLYAQAAYAASSAFDYGRGGRQIAKIKRQMTPEDPAYGLIEALERRTEEATMGLGAIATESVRGANARFSASALSRDYLFLMTREGRDIALAQVSKQTGKISNRILLGRDKKPNYQVDDIAGVVLYEATPSKLVAYQF